MCECISTKLSLYKVSKYTIIIKDERFICLSEIIIKPIFVIPVLFNYKAVLFRSDIDNKNNNLLLIEAGKQS